MCGQKVMNGTVANALRAHFHCTCGSLRSLTPGEWRWRGSCLSGLSHLEIEGEVFFRSLTPGDGGGGFFPASHTWRWRGSVFPVSHTCRWRRGCLSDLPHLEVEGWVSQVSLTCKWRRRCLSGLSHLELEGEGSFISLTFLKWRGVFQVSHTWRWRGRWLSGLSHLKLEG